MINELDRIRHFKSGPLNLSAASVFRPRCVLGVACVDLDPFPAGCHPVKLGGVLAGELDQRWCGGSADGPDDGLSAAFVGGGDARGGYAGPAVGGRRRGSCGLRGTQYVDQTAGQGLLAVRYAAGGGSGRLGVASQGGLDAVEVGSAVVESDAARLGIEDVARGGCVDQLIGDVEVLTGRGKRQKISRGDVLAIGGRCTRRSRTCGRRGACTRPQRSGKFTTHEHRQRCAVPAYR
ncbi:hypothetical protein ACWKSP_39760 [Micromonosporaceae bacterium Da 78-11]